MIQVKGWLELDLKYLDTDLVYNIVRNIIKTIVDLVTSSLNFSRSSSTAGLLI